MIKTSPKKDDSWSQSKAALTRHGLVVYIDAARRTSHHIGLLLALLDVFTKNLRLDFSKPLEDRKPSQNFTISFHLQYLVIWWEVLSPEVPKIP